MIDGRNEVEYPRDSTGDGVYGFVEVLNCEIMTNQF
jgi:hypothetical protein